MKNNEVINNFVLNRGDSKTGHLFSEGRILYSYGYHYPLCIKLNDKILINNSGYSVTTSRHTNELIRQMTNFDNLKELEKNKDDDVVLLDVNKIRVVADKVKYDKLTSYDDLIKLDILECMK